MRLLSTLLVLHEGQVNVKPTQPISPRWIISSQTSQVWRRSSNQTLRKLEISDVPNN